MDHSFKNDTPASAIEVLVNGKEAETFFGKQAVVKFDNMSTYRINEVAFLQTGKVTVTVTVKTEKRTVNNEVLLIRLKTCECHPLCRRWNESAGKVNGPYSF